MEHILSRGDKVIATGRKVEEKLGHVKAQYENIALMELEVTAGIEVIRTQIETAWNIFGHIDVVMNNAGMSAMTAIEDAK